MSLYSSYTFRGNFQVRGPCTVGCEGKVGRWDMVILHGFSRGSRQGSVFDTKTNSEN